MENLQRKIWLQWIVVVTVGELIGFAIPGALGPLSNLLVVKIFGTFPQILSLVLAAIFGAGEGAVLGFAQSLVLKRYIAQFKSGYWIIATASAAVVAWVIGMIPGTFIEDFSKINLFILITGGLVLGVIFLLSIGVAQWFVLRNYVQRAGWWIVANAVAWPVGVMVPVITIALVPNGSPIAVFIIAGIIGGVLMGVVVGAITGFVLARLLMPKDAF